MTCTISMTLILFKPKGLINIIGVKTGVDQVVGKFSQQKTSERNLN